MAISADFIKKIIPECSFPFASLSGDFNCSVDSRTVKKDEIFVALSGAHVDGHDFIADAFARGARGCIIAADKKNVLAKIDQAILKNKMVLVVPDTRQALIDLARAWRAQFTGNVVGITGSVGKTSTKEAVAAILHEQGINYLATEGTQNTVIGISLALLRLKPSHAVAVLELGISKRGEMARLVDLARPTIAVITAIGHSHMEGLGSLNDIAVEKRDIFKYFKSDSIGIINGDQPLLAAVAYHHPVIKFGSKTTNQIQARKIQLGSDQSTFILKLYGTKYKITLATNHKGSVFNVLAACAVAHLLALPVAATLASVQKITPVAGRFERRPLRVGKGMLINDCYNASPESVKAALAAFQNVSTNAHKIAVLGDMLELGVNSPFWHRQIGRFLRKAPSIRDVILVGSHVEWTRKTAPLGVKIDLVPSWKEAVEKLKERLSEESCILVKGSRSLALDNLVREFA
jgi:UDP-N-acetylmuramoyl-tripeptide--D-alanyl-D-alanine ligase